MIELNLQMIGSDRDQMVHHLHAEDTVVCYITFPTSSNDYKKKKRTGYEVISSDFTSKPRFFEVSQADWKTHPN